MRVVVLEMLVLVHQQRILADIFACLVVVGIPGIV